MKVVVEILTVFIILFCSLTVRSEDLEIGIRPSYCFPSFRDDVLEKTLDMSGAEKIKWAGAVSVGYGFSYPDSTLSGKLYPGVRQGAGFSSTFFSHPKSTGVPLTFYIFQGAPIVRLSKNISLDYEWNFGVSAGWIPSDGFTSRSTLIVGSRVNAYINLGLNMNWEISRHYSLIAGMEFTHYSNGNTSFPNPGVNLTGARIGLRRVFGSRTSHTPFEKLPDEDGEPNGRFSMDLTLYGAWRRRVYRGGEEPVLLDGHFPVAGMSIGPMWNAKRWLRIGGSLDTQWDKSTDLKRHFISGTSAEDLRFGQIPFFNQVCMGVAARCELVMPIFSVNVGVGYNIIGPIETKASYQMANLKIYMAKGFFLNVGYQLLNFQRQNNLMLGLGYTFFSTPRTALFKEAY